MKKLSNYSVDDLINKYAGIYNAKRTLSAMGADKSLIDSLKNELRRLDSYIDKRIEKEIQVLKLK